MDTVVIFPVINYCVVASTTATTMTTSITTTSTIAAAFSISKKYANSIV